MSQTPLEDGANDWGLWRYSILSPLLHLQPDGPSQTTLLEDLAGRSWVRPDGRRVRHSAETIRKWLYRYRHGGLPALGDRPRADKGRLRVSPALVDKLFDLRKEHPRWTTQRLLNQLLEAGAWNGIKPSRSALYRFVKARHLQRDPQPAAEPGRAFAFDAFGQLWMADFLHGPKLRIQGHRRKTVLHAIMDDCSRYVVQASFSTRETVETLIGELHDAVRRFGLPQRFYTDNGPCYASRHLKVVCARLGIQLCHTPPYRPQGRGKVERFFRTVREQFLARSFAGASLEELNRAFQQWLNGYHERLHQALGQSPLARRLEARQAVLPVPEVTPLEALFRMERRCRVYRDGTIRLRNRRFEIPDWPPHTRVVVSFLPWDLSRVYYGDELKLARPLDIHANAYRFQHPRPLRMRQDELEEDPS